ncbi:tail protein X [Pectobacteriaceae bacterium CE70]|uniref:Phage tail protein n=1 Tax=Serratia sp. (strain ATCC 39006) TaxID=104623 RepID=A0A2I5T8U8_SERS3|nr:MULTISPECIES: tail protein X [Enterobacterales]WJV60063.1 tail protein X [Pectobacteriaceae bacterium C111]WJV64400.1 tail protein X [Pectobacteriaceae bacterium C52]WJV65168.1 tail protein X [Pectobacteriaceae bacterium CE70]WJY09182.1 tail protein X [Pectobacteriaceae bacterium C80]AUH00974.1 phage tail protein [Serratia sp. ATCC 39006]
MKIYAHQDDTLDALCYRYYGRTQGVVETVLQSNPGLADLGPILPHGTAVELPIIQSSSTRETINIWE